MSEVTDLARGWVCKFCGAEIAAGLGHECKTAPKHDRPPVGQEAFKAWVAAIDAEDFDHEQ